MIAETAYRVVSGHGSSFQVKGSSSPTSPTMLYKAAFASPTSTAAAIKKARIGPPYPFRSL
jgi:hypothetical protein